MGRDEREWKDVERAWVETNASGALRVSIATLSATVQTYAFFLDVQKAFDTVWHDRLWFKLWELGIRRRMWRVIKNMYDITQSAVLLEGEVSEQFNIGQGWHRVVVCRLSSFPFLLISC